MKTPKKKPLKKTGTKKVVVKKTVEKKVYNAIVDYFKNLQLAGRLDNGQLHARKISTKVTEGLLPAQQKKIYSKLSEAAMPVKTIAKKCKLKNTVVAAQLKQIYDRTMLIQFKRDGKNKLWHRAF